MGKCKSAFEKIMKSYLTLELKNLKKRWVLRNCNRKREACYQNIFLVAATYKLPKQFYISEENNDLGGELRVRDFLSVALVIDTENAFP